MKNSRFRTVEYKRCEECISVYEEDYGEYKCKINHKTPFENRECLFFIKDDNCLSVQGKKTEKLTAFILIDN